MNIGRRSFSAGIAAAAAIRPARAATPPLDVIVLGAGVSGLQTAWLLEQQGARVTVLEGRQRVGGRVMTLTDQPGTPEMGFNAMGAGYGRGIDAAKRAGVELVDVAPRFMKAYRQELVLGGQVVPRAAWAVSAANPFPDGHKTSMPWEITPRLMAEKNPLVDWAEWYDPKNAPLDVSMQAFLSQNGLSDAAIRLAFDTAPYYGTAATDVSALLFEFSDAWAKTQSSAGRQSFAVKGGNQKLMDGMAKLLKGDLHLGKKVVAIIEHQSGVRVDCADGTTYAAARVVCSLPFSTLRGVTVEPGLTGPQQVAVESLPYQPISIAFVTADSPFWQQDGLAPSMWTDGILGTVFAQYFGQTADDVTGFMLQARGALANQWDAIGRDALAPRLIAEFEALRPAARGHLKFIALQSWTRDPFSAGDWAYFHPGQIALVREMAAQRGRLHFCGEHTALANRGLEGALESAERVAIEVLSA